ncbi:uncharacterized protein LOC126629675 [Malus sylvestris]|uniref:uncharacterized protein LOC126629675 n=1 Tax=Malus sylvestris TaxID=3752 RepID=UPI0021AC09E0|nr:uncharacterized protein LOC126629675 [Malus sylvestris]
MQGVLGRSEKKKKQKTSPARQDQLKASNLFAFPEKGDYLVLCLRLGLLLCLVTSISLALFFAFSTKSHWFPMPDVVRTRVDSVAPGPGPGPELEPTNITHILFGIGASLTTWRNRSLSAELWWDPNTIRGFLWLDAEPQNETDFSGSIPYRVSEDWTRFSYSSSQSAVRIARIVYESFKLGLPNVRWFVMGDDDTVFFSDNLVSVLARYDHDLTYYIGGNSESVEQNVAHAYDMAYGGGGFAISYPLAARLVGLMDGCLERYSNFYGSDQRVSACVSEMGVPLTKLGGFHQLDIRGDPYGILAAHPLTPLVSLHHLDSMKPMFPSQTHLDSLKSLLRAYRLDPGRILQQSICYDHRRKWSISVSWGYTIQLYPSLIGARELQMPLQTFKTWGTWSDGPFTFNTRPVSSDPCQQPIIYFLDQVIFVRGGSVTIYKRFVASEGKQCERAEYAHAAQRIVVSSKKMDPRYWTKEAAPRRQCCEIKNQGIITNGDLEVRIRTCKPTESITISV